MKLPNAFEPEFEWAGNPETQKSVLIVRIRPYDINLDRVVSKHFIAYDVPAPGGSLSPDTEYEPFELAEFSARKAMDLLVDHLNAGTA